MDQKIIWLILGAVVIFIIGGWLGIFYQTQLSSLQAVQPTSYQQPQIQNQLIARVLSSKVVPLYATGSVTKIDGANITISSAGDSLVVPISNTASVYISKPTTGKDINGATIITQQPNYQPAQLKDIKVGDRLSVGLKLSSDNELEGQAVYISVPPAEVGGSSSSGSLK